MRPPGGYEDEKHPLRHRVLYSFGLSPVTSTMNSTIATILRSSKDVDTIASAIKVNPHNTGYVEEAGSVVQGMSIIDKLSLSIKFNMTENCSPAVDDLFHLKFLWRPIFFSFKDKLERADDDTGTTVATILNLTHDDVNEDVVPLSVNDLPQQGASKLAHPVSTVNQTEAFTDLNMTTDLIMEDVDHDEDLFQSALRRFTNKGALKACVGRTRYVDLTRTKPFKNFYIKKFVPKAIRRVMPFTYMGILVHMPISSEIGQDYHAIAVTGSLAHLGVKIIANYHEWNFEHNQDRTTPV